MKQLNVVTEIDFLPARLRHMYKLLSCICLMIVLSGCSPKLLVPTDTLQITPGMKMTTLTSNVRFSYRFDEKHGSASGMLAYRYPDQVRLIVLSPFGSTMMEFILKQDNVTIMYPGSGTAFHGQLSQLPDDSGRQVWSLLRWMFDLNPLQTVRTDGVFSDDAGNGESITVRDGVVVKKQRPTGDQVTYSDYSVKSGIALPLDMTLETAGGQRIQIVLEDSDVNGPVSEQQFNPVFAGLKIMPLAAFKVGTM